VGLELLASGGTDEVIRVYRLGTRVELAELMEHEDSVLSLAFVGDKFLLSGGNDGKLLLWRTADWNLIGSFKGHKPGPVTSIAVHPSGKVALSTSLDNSLRMWNLETCRPASRQRLSGFRTLSEVRWSPKGDTYCVVGDDRTLMFFSVDDTTGVPRQVVEHRSRINAVAFCGVNTLAVGLESGMLRCFEYDSSSLDVEEPTEIDFGCRIRGVADLSDGDDQGFIVALSNGAVHLVRHGESEPFQTVNAGSTTHLTCLVATASHAGSQQQAKKRSADDASAAKKSKKAKAGSAAAPTAPAASEDDEAQEADGASDEEIKANAESGEDDGQEEAEEDESGVENDEAEEQDDNGAADEDDAEEDGDEEEMAGETGGSGEKAAAESAEGGPAPTPKAAASPQVTPVARRTRNKSKTPSAASVKKAAPARTPAPKTPAAKTPKVSARTASKTGTKDKKKRTPVPTRKTPSRRVKQR